MNNVISKDDSLNKRELEEENMDGFEVTSKITWDIEGEIDGLELVGEFEGELEGFEVVGEFEGELEGFEVVGEFEGEIDGFEVVGELEGEIEGLNVVGASDDLEIELTKIQTAPIPRLSPSPPTKAVFPSFESETEVPW